MVPSHDGGLLHSNSVRTQKGEPAVEQHEILDTLRRHITAAADLRDVHYDAPERKEWEKEAVSFLRFGFGEDSPEVEQFLDAPLPRFTRNMSDAEWQDHYNYLLDNQVQVLEHILAAHEAAAPEATPSADPAPVPSEAPAPEQQPVASTTGIRVRRDATPVEPEGAPAAPEAQTDTPVRVSDNGMHPLLGAVEAATDMLPDVHRRAIIGLENLLKTAAPWPEVRYQLTVVLNAKREVGQAVLRALPGMIDLCTRD